MDSVNHEGKERKEEAENKYIQFDLIARPPPQTGVAPWLEVTQIFLTLHLPLVKFLIMGITHRK